MKIPNEKNGPFLYKQIKNCVNFDFMYEKVASYYSHVGRKSINPVILIKMLLIGYLYGIKSERRLEEQSPLNLACRWFCGIDLTFRMPAYFGKFLMRLCSNAYSLGLYPEKLVLRMARSFHPMYPGTAVMRRLRNSSFRYKIYEGTGVSD